MNEETEEETQVRIVHVASSQIYIRQILGADYTFPARLNPEDRLFFVSVPKESELHMKLFNDFCARNKLEPLFPHEENGSHVAYLPASIELLDQMLSEGVISGRQHTKLYGDYYIPPIGRDKSDKIM